MDEKDIDTILTLAEMQNLTRAAERLYLTQPALTKRIQHLEDDLGAPLLYRTPKGIIFTPEGETVVEYAKALSVTMRKMREHISAEHGNRYGPLHLGCATQYAHYRLPRILNGFLEKYPQINVDVVADRSINIQREMNRNSFSVAIIRGDFEWNGCKKMISSESYYLVCKHETSNDQLRTILYIHQKIDNLGQELADEWVRNNLSFEPRSRVESNSIEVCLSMVNQGIGWAILPGICLERFSGYKIPIYSKEGAPIVRNTYLCYKKSELVLPQVKKFVEHIEMSEWTDGC